MFAQNVKITVIVAIILLDSVISVNSTLSNYLQTSGNVSVLRASGKQKKKSVINVQHTVPHATTIQVYALNVWIIRLHWTLGCVIALLIQNT